MKRVLWTTALVALAAGPAFAHNQLQFKRYYVVGGVGYGAGGDIDGTRTGGDLAEFVPNSGSDTPASARADIQPEANARLQAGFGYRFNPSLRMQFDLVDRFNQTGALANGAFSGVAQNLGDSDVQHVSAMTALIYDFNGQGGDGALHRVKPYVGAGFGVSNTNASANYVFAGQNEVFDASESGPALQALAGIGVELTERLTLDVGYRYHRDLYEVEGEAQGQLIQLGPVDSHDAMIAVRYGFGADPDCCASPAPVAAPVAAPPPVPVAPTPPVQRVPPPPPVIQPTPAAPALAGAPGGGDWCQNSAFVVYFDWDRADLNAEGERIIRTAVEQARACGIERVSVAGHTDTSGPSWYNLGLAQRRADTVRAELVENGVDQGRIGSRALGEAQPAVPTGDGVRERANRRSEVVIYVQ